MQQEIKRQLQEVCKEVRGTPRFHRYARQLKTDNNFYVNRYIALLYIKATLQQKDVPFGRDAWSEALDIVQGQFDRYRANLAKI